MRKAINITLIIGIIIYALAILGLIGFSFYCGIEIIKAKDTNNGEAVGIIALLPLLLSFLGAAIVLIVPLVTSIIVLHKFKKVDNVEDLKILKIVAFVLANWVSGILMLTIKDEQLNNDIYKEGN